MSTYIKKLVTLQHFVDQGIIKFAKELGKKSRYTLPSPIQIFITLSIFKAKSKLGFKERTF